MWVVRLDTSVQQALLVLQISVRLAITVLSILSTSMNIPAEGVPITQSGARLQWVLVSLVLNATTVLRAPTGLFTVLGDISVQLPESSRKRLRHLQEIQSSVVEMLLLL